MNKSTFNFLPHSLLKLHGNDFIIPNNEDDIYEFAHNSVIEAENKLLSEESNLTQEDIDEEREEAIEYMLGRCKYMTDVYIGARNKFINNFGDFYLPDLADEENEKIPFEEFCNICDDEWLNYEDDFNNNGIKTLVGLIEYVLDTIEWEHPSTIIDQFLNNTDDYQFNINKEDIDKMVLSVDDESIDIYIDNGEENEPKHICYWYIDEWTEDPSIIHSMINAVTLFHTNKIELLEKLGFNVIE